MKVAALPSDPAADGECDFHQSVTEHENLFVSLGGNSNLAEIWQIRDYATGDSMRHIHWNQSARMETLLVREYETEEGKSCFLFLTNRRKIEVSEEGMDAFYRALWALAKRVLSAADTLEVLWNCTEPQEARRTAVSEESELAEMMRLLYESGKEPFLRCTDRQMQEMSMAPQFYLDYDLTLYDEEGIEWEWREKNCNQWSKSGKNEGRPYVRTGRFCRRRLRDSFPSSVRPRTFLSCSANRLGCSGFLYFPLVDSLFFCQSGLLVCLDLRSELAAYPLSFSGYAASRDGSADGCISNFCSGISMEEPRLSISVHNSSASGRPSGSDSAGSRKCDSVAIFPDFLFVHTREEVEKRRVTESKGTGRAETHLRITALAFIAVAFTLAAAFVLIGEEQLFQSVDEAESALFRMAIDQTGLSEDQIANGNVSRGNHYQTGTPRLEIQVSQQPEETIYLKGFEGGEYENGQWMPAGEEDVLEQTSQILGWGNWRGTVGTMLDSMYFFMNSSTNPEASEEGRNLTVRYLTRDYSVYYNPYYSVWNRGYFGKSAYRYRYYEQQEMNINWQSASREMGEYARWQRQLQNAYQKAIQKEYTKVDREALPKLSRLCRQQEGSGQEAVTRIILRTLHERASYTQ